MKKKILFIGRFSPPMHGAAKMNGLYFESENIRQNFDVEKIKINYFESLEDMGKYNLSKFLGFFIVFFQLLSKLIFFRPNIIYFEIAAKGVAFYRDSLYAWLCKILRYKLIFAFHSKGVSSGAKSKFPKWYYKRLFKKTKVIMLSKLLYYDIKEIVDEKNVYYVGNGIFDEVTDKEFKNIIIKRQKDKKIHLLFLSNMIESKGPMDVLKVCKKLDENKINFECSLIGKFPDPKFKKKLEKELENLSLNEKCKFLGPQYGDDRNKFFSAADIFIFPTTYPIECYPIVILEALMFGSFVLSYDNAAIKDIVSQPYAGQVFKPGDIGGMKEKVIEISKSGIEYNKIRDLFKKNYTFKTSEKKLNDILKNETK